jgi:hypothetical protein
MKTTEKTAKEKGLRLVVSRTAFHGLRGSGKVYEAVLDGEVIYTGSFEQTKTEVESVGMEYLRDRWKANTTPYVAVCLDGTVNTAYEYMTGSVEVTSHRLPVVDGVLRHSGSMCGGLKIDGKSVTVREYLAHEVARYNECITPMEQLGKELPAVSTDMAHDDATELATV